MVDGRAGGGERRREQGTMVRLGCLIASRLGLDWLHSLLQKHVCIQGSFQQEQHKGQSVEQEDEVLAHSRGLDNSIETDCIIQNYNSADSAFCRALS